MYGYVIERGGVTWNERFWIDIPSVGARGFGNDSRARVFLSKGEALEAIQEIDKEFGYYCYPTKRSDLYPPSY
tara:strand:+ start:666 stop:884 length:219 start_codon:yes stop_codon:yes gene_type:complete